MTQFSKTFVVRPVSPSFKSASTNSAIFSSALVTPFSLLKIIFHIPKGNFSEITNFNFDLRAIHELKLSFQYLDHFLSLLSRRLTLRGFG